jgi:hypothetical protein
MIFKASITTDTGYLNQGSLMLAFIQHNSQHREYRRMHWLKLLEYAAVDDNVKAYFSTDASTLWKRDP